MLLADSAEPVSTLTWADQMIAWASLGTAAFTLLLAVMAFGAWRTAKKTLHASQEASQAATEASRAAREANEQARIDSVRQTRPYVYVEIVPGLASKQSYDVHITNCGRSSARQLTLDFDSWPEALDDVATATQLLFKTPRTLPPGASIRAMWRLMGDFDDGTTEAGSGVFGTITAKYRGDDPSEDEYTDSFEVLLDQSGHWPLPESGSNADHLTGDARAFYRLGQVLVRRIGELGR